MRSILAMEMLIDLIVNGILVKLRYHAEVLQ